METEPAGVCATCHRSSSADSHVARQSTQRFLSMYLTAASGNRGPHTLLHIARVRPSTTELFHVLAFDWQRQTMWFSYVQRRLGRIGQSPRGNATGRHVAITTHRSIVMFAQVNLQNVLGSFARNTTILLPRCHLVNVHVLSVSSVHEMDHPSDSYLMTTSTLRHSHCKQTTT
eukprot:m.682818 g.682818  ORF g.682818 m.682818 type:complete len:173 (+) comp22823_c0_seq14:934-1452(+)